MDVDRKIDLEVQDTPNIPLITAQLLVRDNFLIITGEAHKRGNIPLNGYLIVTILDPLGTPAWSGTAELKRVGLRFFGYRAFESRAPFIPPSGSRVIVEFHKECK